MALSNLLNYQEKLVNYIKQVHLSLYLHISILSNASISLNSFNEMYPSLSNQLTRKKDVNKTDAILIARYYVETRLRDKN